jgi:hypothetical protein
MRQLPAGFTLLGLMCLLFPGPDAALYTDRTNPSPWSLSVNNLRKMYFRNGEPLFQFNLQWTINILLSG